jgi:hypothetical protein
MNKYIAVLLLVFSSSVYFRPYLIEKTAETTAETAAETAAETTAETTSVDSTAIAAPVAAIPTWASTIDWTSVAAAVAAFFTALSSFLIWRVQARSFRRGGIALM